MKRTITLLLVALLAVGVLAPPALALKDDPGVPKPRVDAKRDGIGIEAEDIGQVDPYTKSTGDVVSSMAWCQLLDWFSRVFGIEVLRQQSELEEEGDGRVEDRSHL